MPVPTSHLFDFLDDHASCSIQRHEFISDIFGALRRSIRSIVIAFRDSDDPQAQDITFSLRTVMSEWLTVPIAFNNAMLASLQSMGDDSSVENRWGRDIRIAYQDAVHGARQIAGLENPLRTSVSDCMRELNDTGRNFRIYCHSPARVYFQSLSDTCGFPIHPELFLHSVSQYRNTEPFDVLLKVGPLRSRGWGSAPDALLTAPRFGTLMQFVWSGCADESGFGYDPASAPLPATDGVPHLGGVAEASSPALRIGWTTTQIKANVISYAGPDRVFDTDEFEIFSRLPLGGDRRPATMVQIGAEHGVLYPPHSRVLSFDPADGHACCVDYRLPGETLVEGMFLAIPILVDATLQGVQAEEGHFSRIWKAKLSSAFSTDADSLMRRLRSDGLDLLVLRSRIEHWCKPATTVIHAPQQMRHFEILIRELGVDFDEPPRHGLQRAPWWKYAWDEVRRARGEAIHSGFHEQQLEDEKLTTVLRAMEPQLRMEAATRAVFEQEIPDGFSLQGVIRFYRITVIEDGFLAPSGDLRTIHELSTINQWRS